MGSILTDPEQILAYKKDYFSNIYKEDNALLEPLENLDISNEDLPQVTEDHKQLINTPFTPRDFYTALKELNNKKARVLMGEHLNFT